MENKTKLNIKDWAEEDRPREKMLLKGVGALSDAELLGILIGSGNKNETAVELAQRILHSVSNNLNILGKQEIKELIRNFNGIGEAKAITIAAAMELGKRRKLSEVVIQPQITSSDTVFEIFHPILADLRHEEVWVLLLNRANKVLKKIQVSKGGVTGTVVDIRMIMKEAIDSLASAMVLCHNHPSGNSNPSDDDDNITRRLKEAGQIMDIRLLDHIIVCDHSYYSYMDRGRM
ncbi:MAG: RadC family protein [Dysgonomonas sp.]|jgi:DNA repair protein RadC|uniref:RadC family protein n=1 Tax=unclassified Dysgonomonas TaxID=2630389 RepID=UPI0025B93E23|nr:MULTISPECIES: DNA repair protein RadC [unclassified Dysgonomonas]MDR1714219.1 DNA repair protein RadC [Prevotella sp.]MDR2003651.1 DNA repair protein RadC [Prevotella sp.]HMM01609.1 DNA repair protein RadC [Dysgonomonas sp.]